MDFSRILDVFKLSPKYFFALSIISGALLFFPKNLIVALGLLNFVEKYRVWIGLIFLIFSSFTIVNVFGLFLSIIRKYINKEIRFSRMKRNLRDLSFGEKRILYSYILEKTKTQEFEFSDGRINSLEALGYIYRSSSMSSFGTYWPYNIQPWLWKYLNKNIGKVFSDDEVSKFASLKE